MANKYREYMSKCLRKHKLKGKSKSARRGIFKSCAKSWKS